MKDQPQVLPVEGSVIEGPGRYRRRLTTLSKQALLAAILPIVTAVMALLAWEVLVRQSGIAHSILPPPTAIFDKLLDFLGLLLKHAVPTTYETLMAFGISIPLGIVLAAIMIYSPTINRALYANLVFFQLIPKIALAPMFIVWLGIGAESRVAFSVFICFFPILISTVTGLQAVDRDMLRLCKAVGASDLQVLIHVRFPYSFPYIFAGMKVAVTLAIIGVVVGEFIASTEGLGYLILFASSRQQTDLGLAAITVLCIVGLMFYALVVLSEMVIEKFYGSH